MTTRVIHLAAVLLVSLTMMVYLRAQDNAASSSIQEFFAQLVQHYDDTPLPNENEITQTDGRLRAARPEDVSRSLPVIFAALRHPDERVRFIAARGVLAVSDRGDSAALLNDYIPSLTEFIFSSDKLAQKTALATLATLKPIPPPSVVPPLAKLLKQTGDDRTLNILQLDAIGILASYHPEAPEGIAALEQYLSRPLDGGKRLAILNQLQHSLERNPRIVAKVADMLDSGDSRVKVEAIKTIKEMGKEALLQAQPKLQKLATASDQPAEVKAEANKAIQAISK